MVVTLEAAEGGTRLIVRQEGTPKPIPDEDAATGRGMGLENLARLVEFPTAKCRRSLPEPWSSRRSVRS